MWDFSTLHSRLLSDQTQLKDDVDMLRRENGQLLRERNLLQQSWEDMKRLHEEDQKEIGDLRAQQQQVEPGWAVGGGPDPGQAFIHSSFIYQPPPPTHTPTISSTHPPTHLPTHLLTYLPSTCLPPAIHPCISPLIHLLICHPSIPPPTVRLPADLRTPILSTTVCPCDYLASIFGVSLL